MKIIFEVCIDSIESALNAEKGGADRLEVCEDLSLDGLTPNLNFISEVKSLIKIPLMIMIRPRSENFVYSDLEFDKMVKDINDIKKIGVHGFVFGVLNELNSIDVEKNRILVEQAQPYQTTFHRAFDTVKDPFEALEQLKEIGFNRILTSGQKNKAVDGTELIKKLALKSGAKISIMAGSGVNPENVEEIIKYTRVNEVHASAKEKNGVTSETVVKKIKQIIMDIYE